MDCSKCIANECCGKDKHGHCDNGEMVDELTKTLLVVFNSYDTLLSPFVANGNKPLDSEGFNFARNLLRDEFKKQLAKVNDGILAIARR